MGARRFTFPYYIGNGNCPVDYIYTRVIDPEGNLKTHTSRTNIPKYDGILGWETFEIDTDRDAVIVTLKWMHRDDPEFQIASLPEIRTQAQEEKILRLMDEGDGTFNILPIEFMAIAMEEE